MSLYYRILQGLITEDFTWKDTPAYSTAYEPSDCLPQPRSNLYLLLLILSHPYSVTEASVGVICSSVPYLPALFRHHGAHILHTSHWLYGLLCGWKSRLKKSPELALHHCRYSNPRATALPRMQVDAQVLNSIQGYVP